MAVLSFKVQADYEKVVKLREEIAKLETQLKSFGKNTPLVEIKAVETKLAEAKKEFTAVASEAAKAGAVLDNDFKAKIRESTKSVNDLTAQIIEQKAVIKGHEDDVKRLGEAYRKAMKNDSPKAIGLKAELDAAKQTVDGEKNSLFELTQEKAKAQLATKKLKEEYAEFKEEAKDTAKQSDNLGFSLGKLAGLVGGATVLKQFGAAVVQVRGQFQEMETSIKTLVGDEMTSKLLPQIKELAKTSPLTMTDIVGAEKMMLGFNIEAEKTIDYLKAISDVSMGNSQKFNSLTLAFSQMSAAGKLMGQDLNQMINAGFNPLQQISAKTGKSIARLKVEMSKGAISAEMVQQAFIDATSAGGKFYNMSENASKTINGQISMMQDAMDAMFNDIGTKSEEVIMKGIKTATSLIQNYETVGKVLAGLIVTYGAYKAAVFATIAMEKAATLAKTEETLATWALQKAQAALNATILANPYAAFAAVIAAMATAVIAYERSTNTAKKSQEELNKAIEDSQEAATGELRGLAKLKGELAACEKGTDKYNEVKNKIVSGYGKYYDGLDKEIEKVGFLDETYKKLTESITASFSARQYDKFIKEQELSLDSNLSKNYNKLYERLTKDLGDEQGSEIYTKIRDALMLGQELDADTIAILDKVQHKGKMNADSRVDNWIQNIREEMENFKKVQQEAKVKFGIKDEKKTDGGTPTPEKKTTYAEEYNEAKKQYEADLAAFKEVEQNKTKFTTKKYEERKKKLQSSEDAFKKLGGKTEDKEQKSADEKKKAAESALKTERKVAKDRLRQEEDLDNQLKQLQIDNEKDRAKAVEMQRELDNAKAIQQLYRQQEDYIDAYVQAEKERFEAQEAVEKSKNKDYKKKEFDEKAAIEAAMVSEAYKAYGEIIAKTKEKQNQEQLEAERLANLQYLSEYGDYLQKKEALTKLYQDKINKATTEGEKATLTAERDKLLKELDHSLNKAYQNIFKDPTKMSLTTVKDAISLARSEIQKITSKGVLNEEDLQNIKALQEAVDSLQDYADSARFNNLGDGLDGVVQKYNQILALNKSIKAAQKTGNKEALAAAEEQKKAIQENMKENLVGLGVDVFADGLSKAAASMKQIAQISGDIHLEEQAKALENAGNFISSVASGAASGGWVGALVSGAASIVNVLISSVTESKVVAAEAKQAYEDYLDEIARSARIINDEDYDTIFGVRTLDKVIDASKLAQTALKDYEAALKATGTTYSYGTGKKGVTRWQDSLQNMLVLEGEKTPNSSKNKLQGIQTLSEKFEGLFDEDGNLNLAKAKEVLEAYSKYSNEEWYEALSDATAALEDYEENLAIVDSYLTNLFSNTGSEIADAIMQGNDALEVLEDNAGKIFASIAKDMIMGALMSTEFIDAYKQKLRDAMSTETAEDDASVLEDFVKEMSGNIDDAKEKWEQIKKIAEAYGIDMKIEKEEYQQEATKKGYQTLSEDTGNELVGRATAQYESNLRMEEAMRSVKGSVDIMSQNQIQIRDIASESRDLIATSYLELQQIRENTGLSAKFLKTIDGRMIEWDGIIKKL